MEDNKKYPYYTLYKRTEKANFTKITEKETFQEVWMHYYNNKAKIGKGECMIVKTTSPVNDEVASYLRINTSN